MFTFSLVLLRTVTSGFQVEFRDKVLGVNAHVLVMKYGLDFEEYEHPDDPTKRVVAINVQPSLNLVGVEIGGGGESVTALAITFL